MTQADFSVVVHRERDEQTKNWLKFCSEIHAHNLVFLGPEYKF